jgi:DNA-binding response OmpR family regulator
VITYKEGGELTTKLLKAGAADVLSPPFTSDAVYNRLNNVLQNSWLLTQLQAAMAQNKLLQRAGEEALNWKAELDELRITSKKSAAKVVELTAQVEKLNEERKNLLASVTAEHERQIKEKDEKFASMKESIYIAMLFSNKKKWTTK